MRVKVYIEEKEKGRYPIKMTFEEQNETYKIRARVANKILYFLLEAETGSHWKNDKKGEKLKKILDSLEQRKEADVLFIQLLELRRYYEEDVIEEIFSSSGYIFIDAEDANLLKKYSSFSSGSSGYLKDKKNTQLNKLKEIKEGIDNCFEEIEKKDPTFKRLERFQNNYYNYYYLGEIGKIFFHIENDDYVVKEKGYNGEETVYKSKKNFREAFFLLFDEIEKKRRLDVVFNPPQFHFDEKLGKFFDYETREKIYRKMVQMKTPSEMERYFATNSKIKIKEVRGVQWFEALDKSFVINENRKIELYDKKEDRERRVRKIAHELLEKKLDELFETEKRS